MTYFLCFFIFSFLGWILECIFAYFKTKRFQNRKTMKYLPLCPVYGISVSIMFFINNFIGKNLIFNFILGLIVCTSVEYSFNAFFKNFYRIKFWDYSGEKLNLRGNICVNFSLIWGIFSMILLSFSQNLMVFFSFFPNYITFFLYFCFIVDLFATLYFLKKEDIEKIKFYCQGAKKA